MVNAIGGSGNTLMSMYMERLRAKQSPEEKFSQLDTDSNGGLSKTELETVLSDITAKTGATLSVDDSITSYDADNDSMLNQSEMDTMMRDIVEQYGPPSGEARMEQAISAYMNNSESDQLANLLDKLSSKEMQGPPPPPPPSPEERFAELDTDDNGGLSQTELDVLAEDLAAKTGTELDTEAAIKQYDTDGDNQLNQDEMDAMMQELRDTFGPPPRTDAGASMQEMVASYLEGADSDSVNKLIEILTSYAGTLAASDSSVNTTA